MRDKKFKKTSKMIPYGHQEIDKNDISEVVKVLKSEWITQGPKIEEFERKIVKYCGVKYAVAVSSGTSALHSAYAVAGIKDGDEVITTPLTFAATAYVLDFLRAKPVFADIKSDTFNIDPKEIEKKITKKTKAIAPVDFAGQPCDYEEIFKIARKHKLLVIQDAAQSFGAEYNKKKIGGFSDLTALSFHPVKTITTGEGGMVLTNNKSFYEKLKVFRHHGIVKKPPSFAPADAKALADKKATAGKGKGGWYYEIENIGHNFRITDFQCALGISQLEKIGKFIKRRKEIAQKYNEAFKDIEEIILPTEKKDRKSAWHLYIIQLSLEKLKASRKEIFEEFHKKGVGVQVHYMPLNLHPFFQNKFGYKKGDFPVAENYYQKTITLPLFPGMKETEINKVIETTKKIINNYKK